METGETTIKEKRREKMKIIYYVLECTSFDTLSKADTPNIDSLDPHPAWSWCRMTRGAVAQLLGGFLPTCKVEGCYHNKMTESQNPFFLTDIQKKYQTFIGIPNGWALDYLQYLPSCDKNMVTKWCKRAVESPTTKSMIDYFKNRYVKLYRHYFAYFHVMETHPPFWRPEKEHGEYFNEENRILSIEYVDGLLPELLELEPDFLVVTSDHNIGQAGPWKVENFDVFLATKGKFNKEWW